jgi:hypothetical protein
VPLLSLTDRPYPRAGRAFSQARLWVPNFASTSLAVTANAIGCDLETPTIRTSDHQKDEHEPL